jgi:sarcosine oxidase subunit alpha
MNTVTRLSAGGRVDRARPMDFVLEGRTLRGLAGDSLASALLANDVRIVARSFKYHRPRGVLSAGVEEPNALLTVGAGGRRTPNVPATTLPLHRGLACERQNGWPSVDFDLMAVNSWLAPLIAAGFYYKTFMGPRRGSWMFYEPFIRRAAGLGRADHLPDPDRYDLRNAFADVLVVGSGPAGLAAAVAAGRAGARVLLAEQDFELGGNLLSAPVTGPEEALRRSLLAELEALPKVELLRRTTVIGLYDGMSAALVQRHDESAADATQGAAAETLITLRARAIVHATGAIERPLLFADNDRPGVMLAGAIRAYLNRFALLIGRRVVLATTNDTAWTTALELANAGAKVTLLDERAAVSATLAERARGAGVDVRLGSKLVRAFAGRGAAVRAAEWQREGATLERADCDAIGMSGGWSPTVHLSSHGGVRPVYEPSVGAFVPGAFPAGVFGAGAVLGRTGSSLADAHAAGAAAARYAGATGPIGDAPDSTALDATATGAAVPAPPPARGKVFVDFQNDVTTADIALAHEEGYESVEHLKRYTTLGMGTDQGKTSNVHAARLMAGLRGIDLAAAGTTTYRPPYTPVSLGTIAGRSVGAHFRPTRRTPLHEWHVANGAVMIEAGPWLRPYYYTWAGRDVATAYVEEMRLVRKGVGISDVSSLGKIDVQGPDAATFLDRVYVNGFAKLPVGKARYGVMLNDDATVLDDGTTARFDEFRYFLTTTTAQAGEVMSWLEFLLQVVWPELRVQVASVTDAWAGMSIAGPMAREALQRALPGIDLSNAALPFMGAIEAEIDGTTVRILRLSFSGELAYEVYVPPDRGIAMWTRILDAGAPLGIKPYGLEALASLRIEKGHVAGLELDHRTTLDDLGLGKMASQTKAFVGRALRQRPELQDPERWSLVGLECLEPAARLRGGSILFASGEPQAGHGRGYITSVTWSTELEKYIALGLYKGGLAHAGEEIVCAYPLLNETVRARIVSPHFVDPAGERLHA